MLRQGIKFSLRPTWLLLGGLIVLNVMAMGVDAFVFTRDGIAVGGTAMVERPQPQRDSRANILRGFRPGGTQPATTGPPVQERRQPPTIQEPQRPGETNALRLRPFGPYQRSWVGVSLYVTSFFALLGASTAMVFLWPQRLRRLKETMKTGWKGIMRLALIGFLGYGVASIFITLSGLVIVGLPLAFLIMLGLVLVTLAGLVAVSLTVGSRLAKLGKTNVTSPLFQLILGVLLLFPISIVPFIGWLVVGGLSCLGLGTILLTRFGSEEGWSLAALQE